MPAATAPAPSPAPKKVMPKTKTDMEILGERFKERCGYKLGIHPIPDSRCFRINYIDLNHPKYRNSVADSYFVTILNDNSLEILKDSGKTIQTEENKLLDVSLV